MLFSLLLPYTALRISLKTQPELEHHDMNTEEAGNQDLDESNLDPIDNIEYTLELELAKNFQPSMELVKAWGEASKNQDVPLAKTFAKEALSIPNQCKEQVRMWARSVQPRGPPHPDEAWIKKHPECADPWAGKEMCSNSYEIPLYRLSDLVQYNKRSLPEFVKHFFPRSVGAKYVDKTMHNARRNLGFKAISDIINGSEYESFAKPASNELVVHLRLGDAYLSMMKSNFYYHDKVAQAKKLKMSKVTLIYGDHSISQMAKMNGQEPLKSQGGKLLEKAFNRVDAIEKIFTNAGLPVTKRINFNADCDLVYMANAKVFVSAGGGFSTMTGDMVRRRGGTVLH